jgi:DNA primase
VSDISADAVARARAVRNEDEVARRGLRARGQNILACSCPRCGGPDKLHISVPDQRFQCLGGGSGDVIALVQHLDRSDFAGAVAVLAGLDLASPVVAPATWTPPC